MMTECQTMVVIQSKFIQTSLHVGEVKKFKIAASITKAYIQVAPQIFQIAWANRKPVGAI